MMTQKTNKYIPNFKILTCNSFAYRWCVLEIKIKQK